jgi:hypothetical protein
MLGVALAGILCGGLGLLAGQFHWKPIGVSALYLGAFSANFIFLPLILWATVDLVLILTDNFKDGQGRIIKRL